MDENEIKPVIKNLKEGGANITEIRFAVNASFTKEEDPKYEYTKEIFGFLKDLYEISFSGEVDQCLKKLSTLKNNLSEINPYFISISKKLLTTIENFLTRIQTELSAEKKEEAQKIEREMSNYIEGALEMYEALNYQL